MTEQDVYGVIYVIENKVNGKQYVGQTIRDIKVRFKEHCNNNVDISYLTNSIKYHGASNFSIEEIDSASTVESLNEKEVYWIREKNTIYPSGMNFTVGGTGFASGVNHPFYGLSSEEHPLYGRKLPEEHRNKIGDSLKQAYKEGRKEIDKTFTMQGKTHSEEAKEKMRLAKLGDKNHNYGKPKSDEVKKKISEANKGKVISKETRNKMSLAKKGKNLSSDNHNSKKVINIDKLEVFDSLTDASLKFDIDVSNITAVCRGRRKTTGGFRWMYYEDYLKEKENRGILNGG